MHLLGRETVFNSALTRLGVAIKSRLVRDEEGATAVEYGLIVGLIAVVIIAAVILLGQNLDGMFDSINEELD
jgi:pilus assembly protein Flp/PilA